MARGTGQLAREPRIRFRDAVPVRRDRRDLRRRFRRTARAAMGERKAKITAVLRRLSADQVLLSGVVPGTRNTGKVAVFADGTRLLLRMPRGKSGMECLGRRGFQPPIWLAEVQPCFGRRWFWLGFISDGGPVPVQVLASVAPVPPGSLEGYLE
ncbi:MAG: hypothetical protein ACRDNW_26990 [Trebonia sp.]